jgi:hypothetical protein
MGLLTPCLVFVVGEGLATLIFHLLKKALGNKQVGRPGLSPVARGALERLTMLVGLLAGFPHILTAFGALKISTRLREDQDDHISNTYFLAGNLISLLLAMVYAWVIRDLAG